MEKCELGSLKDLYEPWFYDISSSKDLCLLVVELSGDTQSLANRDQQLS